MSRTIRRKNMKLPYYITHEYEYITRVMEGGWQWREWGWFPRPEKEVIKRIALFYSDNTSNTRFCCSTNGRKEFILSFQNSERRRAKNELRKFMLDEEHDVVVCKNRPFTDYWD